MTEYRVLVTETYVFQTERENPDWVRVVRALRQNRGVSVEALLGVDYYVYRPDTDEEVASGREYVAAD